MLVESAETVFNCAGAVLGISRGTSLQRRAVVADIAARHVCCGLLEGLVVASGILLLGGCKNSTHQQGKCDVGLHGDCGR